jgi:hypothetical protein
MPVLALRFPNPGEPTWPDLAEKAAEGMLHHVTRAISVAGLDHGMSSGKPSVAIRIDLNDGTSVLAETSLALFLTAADGLRAKFGDPRTT